MFVIHLQTDDNSFSKFSKLELLPRLKVDGTPATERKLNRYAQFVKDHYSEVKSGSPWRSHKEVMERLKEIYHQNSQQTAPVILGSLNSAFV